MNNVTLVGRMVADPEVRFMQNGDNTAIARFRLAVPRRYNRDTVDFLNCVAFGKTAEFIEQYLYDSKGLRVGVSGEIHIDSYEKDDETHWTTSIMVNNFEILESRAEQEEREGSKASDRRSSGSKASDRRSSGSKASDRRSSGSKASNSRSRKGDDGFMNIPDGIDEELPFN